MIKLEQLQNNTSVRGAIPDVLVTVVSVQWHGRASERQKSRGFTSRPTRSYFVGLRFKSFLSSRINCAASRNASSFSSSVLGMYGGDGGGSGFEDSVIATHLRSVADGSNSECMCCQDAHALL